MTRTIRRWTHFRYWKELLQLHSQRTAYIRERVFSLNRTLLNLESLEYYLRLLNWNMSRRQNISWDSLSNAMTLLNSLCEVFKWIDWESAKHIVYLEDSNVLLSCLSRLKCFVQHWEDYKKRKFQVLVYRR